MKPLESLLELDPFDPEFPEALQIAYGGSLAFPKFADRPCVYSNFVSTIDGVVSFNVPKRGGAEVSGGNDSDRFIMGLLRASADAVVVGAGTIRDVSPHLWTADYIYPPFTEDYQFLRRRRGKTVEYPMTVVVTASGDLSPDLAIFTTPWIRTLVVTTDIGKAKLDQLELSPRNVRIRGVSTDDKVPAEAVLDILWKDYKVGLALVEGGPKLLGDFLRADRLDEMFLTVAPQISGRSRDDYRPGMVEGVEFPPDKAPWPRLVSLKRASSFLFHRYRFARAEAI